MNLTPTTTRKRINVYVGIKWCARCRSYLAVEHFGLDRTKRDGLSGWCRRCRAGSEKGRRDRTGELTRAALRARYNKDPEQHKARVAVARAIARGVLTKPTECQVCRRGRRIEAHHHCGYERKNWLNIVWRCRQCHTLEHKRYRGRRIAAA